MSRRQGFLTWVNFSMLKEVRRQCLILGLSAIVDVHSILNVHGFSTRETENSPFTWNLPAQGLSINHQQKIADAVSRAHLDYTLIPNNNIILEQSISLASEPYFLHRLYPLTSTGANLVEPFLNL